MHSDRTTASASRSWGKVRAWICAVSASNATGRAVLRRFDFAMPFVVPAMGSILVVAAVGLPELARLSLLFEVGLLRRFAMDLCRQCKEAARFVVARRVVEVLGNLFDRGEK